MLYFNPCVIWHDSYVGVVNPVAEIGVIKVPIVVISPMERVVDFVPVRCFARVWSDSKCGERFGVLVNVPEIKRAERILLRKRAIHFPEVCPPWRSLEFGLAGKSWPSVVAFALALHVINLPMYVLCGYDCCGQMSQQNDGKSHREGSPLPSKLLMREISKAQLF